MDLLAIPLTRPCGFLTDRQDEALQAAAKPYAVDKDASWDEIATEAEDDGEYRLADLIRSWYTWGC